MDRPLRILPILQALASHAGHPEEAAGWIRGEEIRPRALAEMQKIIDAEKSDLFDVLVHVTYARPPRTREARAAIAKLPISTQFTSTQEVFFDFVLSQGLVKTCS